MDGMRRGGNDNGRRGFHRNGQSTPDSSVTYGRWLASTAVVKAPGLPEGAHGEPINRKQGLQENNGQTSMYFHKSVVQVNSSSEFEFGFESLQRCLRGNKKAKMTSNASQCLSHFREIKRLNEHYLGPDAAFLKGFMMKEKYKLSGSEKRNDGSVNVQKAVASGIATCFGVGLHTPSTSSRVVKFTEPTINQAPSVGFSVPKKLQQKDIDVTGRRLAEGTGVLKRAVPPRGGNAHSGGNAQSGVIPESASSRTAAAANHSKGGGLLTRAKMMRQASKAKMKREKSGVGDAGQLKWGSSAGPKSLKSDRPAMNLVDFADDEEFVFNPKFAEDLRKLPELRHQVIPANAVRPTLPSSQSMTPRVPPGAASFQLYF